MMIANEGESDTWPNLFLLTGVISIIAVLGLELYRLYYWLRYGEWLKQFVWQLMPLEAKWVSTWESWLGLKRLLLWTLQSDLSGFAMTIGIILIIVRFLIWG
jgi:hypothetical protein